MARGDTQPPRRAHFDDSDEAPVAASPRRVSYPCWADDCPMPGTIFAGGSGVCSWHFGQVGDAIKVVTRAILDWQCLQSEINIGRRVLTAPDTLANPKALDAALRDAWARVLPAVLGSGWKVRIEPRVGELYGEWVRRIERFLSNRVKESLRPGVVITDDDAKTPLVGAMLKEVHGVLAAPAGEWQ